MEIQLQKKLQYNISYLRSHCDELHHRISPSIFRIDYHDGSPIFSVRTMYPRELARYCQQHGLIVRPIMSPTVPRGKERVRVCLHAANTHEEIKRLVETMVQWAGSQVCSLAKL